MRPAIAPPHIAIGDHVPIIRPIPCDVDETKVATKRLKVDALTEAERQGRRDLMGKAIADSREELVILAYRENVDHLYNTAESLLNRVFEVGWIKQIRVK